MPQREPLSAPLLGALLAVAGLASGWVLLALESLAQAGAGSLAGFPWQSISIEPPYGLPLVRTDLQGTHDPWSWAVFLLAGPVAALLAGTVSHFLAEGVGAPAWLRALGFEAFAIAWLRLPLVTLAAGLPRGRGPVATLYEKV